MVKWLTHLAVNQAFVSSILITRPIKSKMAFRTKKCFFFVDFCHFCHFCHRFCQIFAILSLFLDGSRYLYRNLYLKMTWKQNFHMRLIDTWKDLFLEKIKTDSMIGSKASNNLGGQLGLIKLERRMMRNIDT